jgi:predicted MFS family arabinose efflux permease
MAFWLVAYVFLATMIGTTLPTPLYVIYEAQWHFSSGVVTLIFATYAAGVLAALLLLGPASDRIGRLPVLWTALAFSALSTVLFILASGTGWLYPGRLLSGFSAGLVTGTGTAALTDLAGPADVRRASIVSTAVTTGGLGLGPLLAGVLAEYAPHPTVLVFEVYLGLLGIAAAALVAVPETVARTAGFRLQFRGFSVPPPVRTFLAASLAGFAALALMGLFTALAPSLLGGVLHVRNHAIGGLLVFLLFGASTATQVSAGNRSPAGTTRFGLGVFLLALALMVGALGWESMPLFVLCAVVGGVAAGATFLGSLSTANRLAPPAVRGQAVSTYFTVAYIGLTVPVIGVGFSAEHIGYLSAVSVCAAWLAALCLAALVRPSVLVAD